MTELSNKELAVKHFNDGQYVEALRYCNLVNDISDANIMNMTGYLYRHGNDKDKNIEQDDEIALAYFILAARKNNTYAQNNLGNMYYSGAIVKQDYKKAHKYYMEAIKQNNTVACCSLGNMYRLGQGADQDYKKAIEYYTKAEKNRDAQYQLGYMYAGSCPCEAL